MNQDKLLEVSKKLDSFIGIFDQNQDYEFVENLEDSDRTLTALMIARGVVREHIVGNEKTLEILVEALEILEPLAAELT